MAQSADLWDAPYTPVVVRLTDSNGDGVIDSLDTPDVVFLHDNVARGGVLTAVNGATGKEIFTTDKPRVYGSVAAGDIDGDGFPELISLVFPESGKWALRLVAFDHTGQVKWTSPAVPETGILHLWAIGIADLDQDGTPEIFAGPNVFNADGSLRWIGTAGEGSFSRNVNAVNLVCENPGLELLAGNTAYDANGGIVWYNPNLPDGFTAVADFDGDGMPEIVLAHYTGDELYLLDHLGNPLGGKYSVPGGYINSRPVVADLDGDGVPEVFVISRSVAVALKWTGTEFVEMWEFVSHHDYTGCCDQAVAYDFDGDGASEIVFKNEDGWYILDGRTGNVLSEEAFPSDTSYLEAPIVADIDGDGNAEIVMGSEFGMFHNKIRPGVAAWKCASSTTPRAIWNEFMYHICNVNDDGSIPRFEAPSWLLHNSWIAQAGPGNCKLSDEDEDEDSDGSCYRNDEARDGNDEAGD
jgi:hypothetical protein